MGGAAQRGVAKNVKAASGIKNLADRSRAAIEGISNREE
jgi:hypothetical protein